MQQLRGKAVSPGYVEGNAFVYNNRHAVEIPCYEITEHEVAEEHRRLREAITRSFQELKQLEHEVLAKLGETHSAIFAAHLGLLQDQQFAERVKDRIQRDLVNVEQALDAEVADLCDTLAAVENEYLRERAQDIRDVGSRVLRQLAHHDMGHYEELPPQSVIVARELLPSETLDLDRKHVVGIVTEAGGENSHAAILSRALGIPAVTGIADATSLISGGTRILIDGENGVVSVMPNKAALADFALLKSHYDDDTSAAVAAEGLGCVTRDGTRISLLANINRPHDTDSVATHHLDGVGLFRTEFMYIESSEPPGFDRQVAVYRQMIDALADRPLVIRTLDLGGDKLPAFLSHHHKPNPLVSLRGLQFSLAERSLLETQMQAIITASAGHDDVRVLLPMVLGEGDLADAIALLRKVSTDLGCTSPLKVGAMVETPAALFALDEIMQLADFVCIGTNDLTQYMLAADRNASGVEDCYSVLHPSVLRAIARVVDAGRLADREVCVCGESASYPQTACLLVGLGVRQLSMSPVRAARVRYLLRATDLAHLEDLAADASNSSSIAAVRKLLQDSRISRATIAPAGHLVAP